VLLFVEGI